MNDTEIMPIAAHIYVTLRRKLNRVIDVEWMLRNQDYAREVIQIARKPGVEELAHYVDRIEALIFGKVVTPLPVSKARDTMRALPETGESGEDAAIASQYIGSLR